MNNHIPADCETYYRLSNLKTLVLGPGPGNGTLYVGNDIGIFTCVTPGTLPEEEPVDKSSQVYHHRNQAASHSSVASAHHLDQMATCPGRM
jgi:hypothetical protein